MARAKKYNEEEVIEKAMYLFWRNGYENTSVRMLEREMGINQFSIYASFGNKHGVFLESLKCYKAKTNYLFEKLTKSTKGVEDIKQFFYDSIAITGGTENNKGCFLTNTYNEFVEIEDQTIRGQINEFMENLKFVFIEKLKINSSLDEETIIKQANYLVLAKHGLAAATRINSPKEIEDYIEFTFKNI